MTRKPPKMTRRKWVIRQLVTFWYFLMGISFTAGWARYLMGDHLGLPWPLYPLGGALFLWTGVMRLIEDETRWGLARAAEIADELAEGVANPDKPYNEAFIHACGVIARAIREAK